MSRSDPRVCPYCGYVDQTHPGKFILAVFDGRAAGAMLGGCSCPLCDGEWQEFAYRDGRTINVLVDGRKVEVTP